MTPGDVRDAIREALEQVDREIAALTRLEVSHGKVLPAQRGPLLDRDRVQEVLRRATQAVKETPAEPKMGCATQENKLLARVENEVQYHELWVKMVPCDPLLNSGTPLYPMLTFVEKGGAYRGERTIDLGTLTHLALNVTEQELSEIAGRSRDWTGRDTVGPKGTPCPHGPDDRSMCNTCHEGAGG